MKSSIVKIAAVLAVFVGLAGFANAQVKDVKPERIPVTSNLAQGKSQKLQSKSQKFQISEDGNLKATVINERNDEEVKVSILRPNQPTHVYRTAISAGVTSVHVKDRQVLAYQNNSKRIEIGNTDFIATEVNITARKARSEVSSLSQELADDMRILRAVREFAPNADVTLAELAYVIATGEDSIYVGEALKSLQVSETRAKGL
jgi:hypothetical protein